MDTPTPTEPDSDDPQDHLPDQFLVTCTLCNQIFPMFHYPNGTLSKAKSSCSHDTDNYRRINADFTLDETAPEF